MSFWTEIAPLIVLMAGVGLALFVIAGCIREGRRQRRELNDALDARDAQESAQRIARGIPLPQDLSGEGDEAGETGS